jgi:hypothetical protein
MPNIFFQCCKFCEIVTKNIHSKTWNTLGCRYNRDRVFLSTYCGLKSSWIFMKSLLSRIQAHNRNINGMMYC